MKKRILGTIIIATACIACGPSQAEYDQLTKINESLQQEIESLKTEIENYQNTPDKLYKEAEYFIINKDIQGLQDVINKFLKYHPTSGEYTKAQSALNKLTEAENARIKAEEAKRLQAVNKLRKEADDINGITWYYNPYFTHYNNSNHVSVYMGKREQGKPWLRLRMSYYGDNWIFFDTAYLSYDGNTRQIFFNEYEDKKSDNDSSCWEWIDVGVDEYLLAYLKEMIDGKTIKMRLSGKYTKDKVLSSAEKNGIKDVLLAYDVLTNEQ